MAQLVIVPLKADMCKHTIPWIYKANAGTSWDTGPSSPSTSHSSNTKVKGANLSRENYFVMKANPLLRADLGFHYNLRLRLLYVNTNTFKF